MTFITICIVCTGLFCMKKNTSPFFIQREQITDVQSCIIGVTGTLRSVFVDTYMMAPVIACLYLTNHETSAFACGSHRSRAYLGFFCQCRNTIVWEIFKDNQRALLMVWCGKVIWGNPEGQEQQLLRGSFELADVSSESRVKDWQTSFISPSWIWISHQIFDLLMDVWIENNMI